MSVCGNYLLLEPKTCDCLSSGAIPLPPALRKRIWKSVNVKSTFFYGHCLASDSLRMGMNREAQGSWIGREGSFRRDSPAAYWTKTMPFNSPALAKPGFSARCQKHTHNICYKWQTVPEQHVFLKLQVTQKWKVSPSCQSKQVYIFKMLNGAIVLLHT